MRFPCWSYRETENRQTSRYFILSEVIKSVGLNFLPAVHFCFCTLCVTVGAVPMLKLSRDRESANVKVLYFVGSDQKCGTKFSARCAYWWQKKESRQVLSLKKKKSRKTKNWFNSTVCVLEISDLLFPCILQRTQNNNSVGRYNFITFRIMSLVKSRQKND